MLELTVSDRSAGASPGPYHGPVPDTPVPFIVGFGRSGTTLLRVMIDSHPEIAIGDETHFILPLARRRREFERPEGFAVEHFVAEVSRRPGFKSLGVRAGDLRACLDRHPVPSLPDAIRALFRLSARTRGKPRYGDKTPIHVRSIPALGRMFPEARFVHVVRDGRDAALSYLSVPWGPCSVEEAAYSWRRAVLAGRRGGRDQGPERYREVRYEALVSDPAATLRGLTDFLELTFDPAMLRYHERATEIVTAMGHPETRAGLYLPPTPGLRDWRTQMTTQDARVFDAIAGRALTAFGYERSFVAPGGRAAARAGCRLARSGAGRLRRRLRMGLRHARARAATTRTPDAGAR